MIQKLSELGKPMIFVLFSGRPLEIKPVLVYAQGVLQAWFLDSESGNVLADILTGNYNPSGRLSISFPQNAGQVPVYYNHYNTGRPNLGQKDRYISRYLDCENDPLFCFGYGLSYSEFEYRDFAVCQKEGKDEVEVRITVKNSSERSGRETVQLYIHDVAASVVRPLKELKDFKQVDLEPGQEEKVVFAVDKEKLKFWNPELQYVFEPGAFDFMIGRNSAEVESKRLYIA